MNYQNGVNACDDSSDEEDLWRYLPLEPIVKVEEAEDGASDDEIVPSSMVEPILLKPDSTEDEEIVLDLKPQFYSDNHSGSPLMDPYHHQEQSWSSDVAKRTIREMRLRAAESRLAAVQARRRAQLLLGPTGIHKLRDHMAAFRYQRYTAKYRFHKVNYL